MPPPRGLWAGPVPTQGAGSSDKDPPARVVEPADHAIGRSRGGLTTKTHALVDGNGMPLVIALTPGQANDSPALSKLLAELRIPRVGPGRPRTTPEALRADKAYSARGHRAHLRSRGITAVIPNLPTRSDTARTRAHEAVDLSPSTPATTRTATS